MSFLINMLVVIGFAAIFLIFLWWMTRGEDNSGFSKIFAALFIVMLVLAFVVWLFMK